MMDATTGWAEAGTLGGTDILRTTDAGATWRQAGPGLPGLNRDGAFYDRPQPFFLDAQSAWVLKSGILWRTHDGGQSWTTVGQKGETINPEIWFNDSRHGWKLEAEYWGLSFVQMDIVSFSTTQDGGQTWTNANPPPGGGPIYLAYAAAQLAWGVRAAIAKSIEGFPNLAVPFHLVRSADGGQTWTSQEMPLPPATEVATDFSGASMLDAGNCDFYSPVYSSVTVWKLALACERGAWLYTTVNQGKTWIISPLPQGEVAAIQFISPTQGWLLGGDKVARSQRQLYQTKDGGQTWTLLKRTGWADAQLDFIDAQTGWAVASACADAECTPSHYVTALVRTTDGGITWQDLKAQIGP